MIVVYGLILMMMNRKEYDIIQDYLNDDFGFWDDDDDDFDDDDFD